VRRRRSPQAKAVDAGKGGKEFSKKNQGNRNGFLPGTQPQASPGRVWLTGKSRQGLGDGKNWQSRRRQKKKKEKF